MVPVPLRTEPGGPGGRRYYVFRDGVRSGQMIPASVCRLPAVARVEGHSFIVFDPPKGLAAINITKVAGGRAVTALLTANYLAESSHQV